MSKLSVADWIQTVTGLAIVVGLGLVLFEMKQAREIAATESTSQHYDAVRSHYDTLLGENPTETLSKACTSPETLTAAEKRIVNAYFHSQFVTVRRLAGLTDQGDIGNTSEYWQGWATGIFQSIFGYPDGAAWWVETRKIYSEVFPEVVDLGDRLLDERDGRYQCESYYDDWGKPNTSATPTSYDPS